MHSRTMKALILLTFCFLSLIGCGGNSGTTVQPQLAGSYFGTWVNIDDPLDTGVSEWMIGEHGTITGNDIDATHEFSYTVFGTIDSAGNADATTSLIGGEEVISLDGHLQFDAEGHLTGDLVWASEPPLTYRYTFTRETTP